MATAGHKIKQSVNAVTGEAGYLKLHYDADGEAYVHLGTEQRLLTLPDSSGASDGEVLQVSGGVPSWGTIPLPAGVILPYGGTIAPDGFLLCDGSEVSRTTYARLFAVIGTAFGAGDGSTTFLLPDTRGMFLRGTDNGAGVDPDAATRPAAAPGGSTGDAPGSVQPDATGVNGLATGSAGAHTHTASTGSAGAHDHGVARRLIAASGSAVGAPSSVGSADSFVDGVQDAGAHTHAVTVNSNGAHLHALTGDAETRPANVSVNYIIKT